jgi:hypothetical protein
MEHDNFFTISSNTFTFMLTERKVMELLGFGLCSSPDILGFTPQMALVVDATCVHRFFPLFIALVLMHLVLLVIEISSF